MFKKNKKNLNESIEKAEADFQKNLKMLNNVSPIITQCIARMPMLLVLGWEYYSYAIKFDGKTKFTQLIEQFIFLLDKNHISLKDFIYNASNAVSFLKHDQTAQSLAKEIYFLLSSSSPDGCNVINHVCDSIKPYVANHEKNKLLFESEKRFFDLWLLVESGILFGIFKIISHYLTPRLIKAHVNDLTARKRIPNNNDILDKIIAENEAEIKKRRDSVASGYFYTKMLWFAAILPVVIGVFLDDTADMTIAPLASILLDIMVYEVYDGLNLFFNFIQKHREIKSSRELLATYLKDYIEPTIDWVKHDAKEKNFFILSIKEPSEYEANLVKCIIANALDLYGGFKLNNLNHSKKEISIYAYPCRVFSKKIAEAIKKDIDDAYKRLSKEKKIIDDCKTLISALKGFSITSLITHDEYNHVYHVMKINVPKEKFKHLFDCLSEAYPKSTISGNKKETIIEVKNIKEFNKTHLDLFIEKQNIKKEIYQPDFKLQSSSSYRHIHESLPAVTSASVNDRVVVDNEVNIITLNNDKVAYKNKEGDFIVKQSKEAKEELKVYIKLENDQGYFKLSHKKINGLFDRSGKEDIFYNKVCDKITKDRKIDPPPKPLSKSLKTPFFGQTGKINIPGENYRLGTIKREATEMEQKMGINGVISVPNKAVKHNQYKRS